MRGTASTLVIGGEEAGDLNRRVLAYLQEGLV